MKTDNTAITRLDKHLRNLRGLLILLLVLLIPYFLATGGLQYLDSTGRYDAMLRNPQSRDSAVDGLRSLCQGFFILTALAIPIVGYSIFIVRRLRRENAPAAEASKLR